MRYRLLQNLGSVDAATCKKLGSSLDGQDLKQGSVVNLNDAAAGYLQKKYKALLEPADAVKGVAPAAKIQGIPAASKVEAK